jgi:hypothetical protein
VSVVGFDWLCAATDPCCLISKVSYVCGDVNNKVASYCNGKRLDIYANLDHALRRWRSTPKQNWLRIWADAM